MKAATMRFTPDVLLTGLKQLCKVEEAVKQLARLVGKSLCRECRFRHWPNDDDANVHLKIYDGETKKMAVGFKPLHFAMVNDL